MSKSLLPTLFLIVSFSVSALGEHLAADLIAMHAVASVGLRAEASETLKSLYEKYSFPEEVTESSKALENCRQRGFFSAYKTHPETQKALDTQVKKAGELEGSKLVNQAYDVRNLLTSLGQCVQGFERAVLNYLAAEQYISRRENKQSESLSSDMGYYLKTIGALEKKTPPTPAKDPNPDCFARKEGLKKYLVEMNRFCSRFSVILGDVTEKNEPSH